MIIKNKYAQFIGYLFSGMGGMVVQKFTAPDADAADVVLGATALTDAAQTITTGITQPDFPRGLSIQGNAGGNAGDVVITGQNIRGKVITETIALNGASEVQGSKAFALVTSILVPAETHAGTDTVSVGINDKLGLQSIPAVTACVAAYQDNTLEGTLPTVTTHATDIESCTADPNTACDASKDFLLIYPTRERATTKGVTS